MASEWQVFVDEVMLDLVTNVPGLRDVYEHRYSPADPAELGEDTGRHLSIFPVAEQAQSATPHVTAPGGDLLTEVYRIIYWEDASGVSARGVEDEEAWKALLELAQATRDRFYKIANLRIGGTRETRYLGMAFPDRSSQVRWFAIGVQAQRDITAT